MSNEEQSLPPVNPGDILAGKYQVERVLGSGGMGVVVAARHLELDERVAVKFLLPHAVGSTQAAARFVREARAAVKIKSEHVARVIDVGRLENGAPYMVMEFLDGRDLSALTAAGPCPIEDAIDYVIQACDAMAEAHSRGIVHRDLKPANLFLTQRADGSPVVKVLDFGISKVAVPDASEPSLTRTATPMGSPLYMSPEQMRSARDVDWRTDVWSLGAIAYELLTARTPFWAESYPELCVAILSTEPIPIRQLRPEVPAELERAVMRCLRKDPAARFGNVGELARALAPFAPARSREVVERAVRVLSRAGVSSSEQPPPPEVRAATQPLEARTRTAWAETQAPVTRKRGLLYAVAAFVLLSGGAVAFAIFGPRIRPAAPPAASGEESAPAAPDPELASTPEVQPEPIPEPPPIPAPPSASAEPAVTPAVPVASPAQTARAKPPRPAAQPPPEPPPAAPPPPPPPPLPKNPLDIPIK
jgi:eukaryotic-like serine/threonine-protein kinase